MKTQHVPQRHGWMADHVLESALIAVTVAVVLLVGGLYLLRGLTPATPVTSQAARPMAAVGAPDLGFDPGTGTVYDGKPYGRGLVSPVPSDLDFDPGTGTVYDGKAYGPALVAPVPSDLGFNPGTGTVYDGGDYGGK